MNAEPVKPWVAIGARIRDARLAAGLSQAALAARIGTSRRHVIRLEHGEHRPSPPMLRRIAEATGRETSSIDPDEKEDDMQLASVLIELVRLQVRELVRAELRELGGAA
jgi:transcriptional regulator with XRE-family HTH domain